ncbi:HD domain-containing protein [Psychrosphaera sp. F3M07]|uniref:HD-GYP domain-containing protein n=1 Tax=Psychrosphaera sp. F3M07 TaxID=2841560 RepID=UPI001C0962F4|nr:HD domain-containing phosphohydrolase [Psychrosphaera sp. F3M07]MBU2917956.1 HD domain-containing protein [Psychrosphaera sp. F3M07]
MIQDKSEVYTGEDVLISKESHDIFLAMYEILAQTLMYRDPYTHEHQKNVAFVAQKIGVKLNLTPYQMTCLRLGASIHDIGKIKVPMELLYKPGKIEKEEFKLVKKHAVYGADLFRGYKLPWPIYEVVSQHHERIDGSGYPKGLKGDQISLEAKIVAIADTYESMSNNRPYRRALGTQLAIQTIVKGRGTKYDIDAVDAFMACVEEDETFEGLFTIK